MTYRARPTFAIAALIGVALIAGCESLGEFMGDIAGAAPKPTADVQRVGLSALTMEGATLDFDVLVSNPYSVPLPLGDVDFGLSSGGTPFLSGSTELEESIPAGGAQTVKVPATITFSSLMQSLQGVRPGSTVPYTANLGISVDTPGGRITLPLERSGEIPVPAVPEITIAQIAIQQFTLQEGKALVKLQVVNPNSFDLNLTQLDYGLKLAGVQVANANIASPVSIQPGATGIVEIPISVNPLIAGPAVRDAFLRGTGTGYDLSGTMKLGTPFGGIDAPFRAQGNTPFIR